MAERRQRLLDVINAFRSGQLKASEIRPGIRKKVQRMSGEITDEQMTSYATPPSSPPVSFGVREHIRRARTV